MAQPQLESAFVDWVNTFDKFSSSPITSINDLTDGTALIEVVCEIDPKWFKVTRADTSRKDNWVTKYSRIKRMYALLIRYYEENLGLSTKNIESLNLSSMVEKGDVNEAINLCSLVVTLAVRHVNNASYIEKIQSLSPKSQEGLMVSIESVMNKMGDPTVPTSDKQSNYNADEEIKKMNLEFNNLLAEKDTIQKAYQNLMEEHTTLSDQRDDLQGEVEDLKQKLKDMEVIPQSSQGGKAEFLLKTEADQLRHELARSEKKRHEIELILETSNAMIGDLTRKVESLKGYADEAAKLKDQVDENRHAADKLKKIENVIEKYKKKLDEAADVRRSLKVLEQENRDLIERNQAIHEEYQKMSNYKALVENYKQQVIDLQTEKTELLNDKNKYEYEYKHWRASAEASRLEKSRDTETIHLLEDRIRELELGEGETLNLEEEKNDAADEIDQTINDSELTDALKGTTMTKLKLRIHELEREVSRLREGKSADSNAETNLIVLQSMLDDASRVKEKIEKDYLKVHKEKLVLESELASYKSGSGSNKSDSNVIDMEFRDTKRKLIEAELKLTQYEKEMNEPKPDPNLEIRMKDLEAENGVLKRQNDELMDFLKNLESNNNNGEDTKNQIAQFHKQLADSNKKFDNSKIILVGYHSVIDKLTKENEAYKIKIAEMEKQFSEEFALMTSAWYNIGRRIQGDHVSIQRRKPTSFLGQQRLLHDNQLKRR